MNAPDYPDWVKEALACMAEMAGKAVFCELTNDTAAGAETEQVPEYAGEGVLMKHGLVVRHLVIPGQTEDTKHVLQYLHETYGDRIWISLMSQYTPVGRFAAEPHCSQMQAADRMALPELFRKVTPEEYDEVVDFAIDLGIENCMIQEEDVADDSFIPVFDGTGI